MKKNVIILLIVFIMVTLSGCVHLGRGVTPEDFNNESAISEWPEGSLAESQLPFPDGKRVEITYDSDDSLFAEVYAKGEQYYNNYLKELQNYGYTLEANKSSVSYEAFNESGYLVNIISYSDGDYSIHLEAPKDMGDLRWPNSDLAKSLPVPESNKGRVEWEKSDGFVIYVGETDITKFQKYVDKCVEYGFTEDYRRGDDYYYAKNANGDDLSLKYEGNNVMFVRVDSAKAIEELENWTSDYDEDIDEWDNSDDSDDSDITNLDEGEIKKEAEDKINDLMDKADNTLNELKEKSEDIKNKTKDIVDSGEVDPDLKAFLDEYEKFMDEYIEFMNEYNNSSDVSAMMNQYVEFIDEYAKYAEAIDKYDADKMSASDAAYYLEVVGRVEKKLLKLCIKGEIEMDINGNNNINHQIPNPVSYVQQSGQYSGMPYPQQTAGNVIQQYQRMPNMGYGINNQQMVIRQGSVARVATNRGLVKFVLLGIITFGIYPLVVMSEISSTINIVATQYDGKRTMHYCALFFLIGPITLGIADLIWNNNICGRIGGELNRRGIRYGFSALDFWLWGIIGALIIVGPFIYKYKMFKAMNLICRDYNVRG